MKIFKYPIYVLLYSISENEGGFAKISSPNESQEVHFCPPLRISIEREDKTGFETPCYSFKRVQSGDFVRFFTKHEYETVLKKTIAKFSE